MHILFQYVHEAVSLAGKMFNEYGQPNRDIDPERYASNRVVTALGNYALSHHPESSAIFDHAFRSVRGLMWATQKIYMYKIIKFAIKNPELTETDIAAQALKARKVGEMAVKDLSACLKELRNVHANDLIPGFYDEPRFYLTEEVLKIRSSGVDVLKYISEKAPSDMTENIEKCLKKLDKYDVLRLNLDPVYIGLACKAHKIAMFDFNRKSLFGDPWIFSSTLVREESADAFSSMEEVIKAHEEEIGEIINVEPIILKFQIAENQMIAENHRAS